MKEESLITKMLKRKDIVLLAIVAALCLLLFRQCDSNLSLKSQIKIQNMNLDALKDTVRIQENKAGEATYVRKTLLSSKEDLEKLNKIIGMEEEAASLYLKKIMYQLRVVERDGKRLIVLLNFASNIVNVAVNKDLVTKIIYIG